MIELHSTVAALIAFMIGAIPFGVIVGKFFGVTDLKKIGSGNTGATNVVRAAGWKAGAITFLLDGLKAYLPMLLIQCAAEQCGERSVWLGFLAVLGHCYSPFLKFEGGKGVSSAFGVFYAIHPLIGVIASVSYVLTLALTKVSAIGSLIAMIAAIAATYSIDSNANTLVAVFFIVFVVIYRHKQNLKDLFSKMKKSGGNLAAVALFLTTDFSGSNIDYKANHQKVVALMPSIAEIAIELGAANSLIAVPEYTRLTDDVKKKSAS